MNISNCSLDIYCYKGNYIFCGETSIYLEKYQGYGPGLYRDPILVLTQPLIPKKLQSAIEDCISVLHEKETIIIEDNNAHDYVEMEQVRFDNFNKLGIKASKSSIIKNSILISITLGNLIVLVKSKPEGRYMVVCDKIKLPANSEIEDIAQSVLALVQGVSKDD